MYYLLCTALLVVAVAPQRAQINPAADESLPYIWQPPPKLNLKDNVTYAFVPRERTRFEDGASAFPVPWYSVVSLTCCARWTMRAIDGWRSASFAARAEDALAESAESSPWSMPMPQRFRWSFTSLRRSIRTAALRPSNAVVCAPPKSTWSRQAASRARPRCDTPSRALEAPQRWPTRLDPSRKCGGHAMLAHRGARVGPQVGVREQRAVAMFD